MLVVRVVSHWLVWRFIFPMLVTIPIMMRSIKYFLCIGLLWVFLFNPTFAGEFQLREQNPLALVFGLPLPGYARQPSESAWRTDVLINVSNTTNVLSSARDSLIIDGETAVLDVVFSRSINNKLSIGAHIPFISHSGGSLDSFIKGYHDLLGFPQGERDEFKNNQLHYQYIRDGKVLLNQTGSSSGLGDIRALIDYQLSQTDSSATALHASLKLPTGDSARLTGSEAVDFSAWLSGEYAFNPDWNIIGHAGFLGLGSGEILPAQQRDAVFFTGGALAWQFTPAITLQLQADWHSAFFDGSDLKLLGPALTLSTGGFIRISNNSEIAIAVVEDIDVDSAPDVQFHVGWHYQPKTTQ